MTYAAGACVPTRKHERCVPETAYVAYKMGLPFFGQKGESAVIDISQCGLLMQIPERVKWGSKVRMELKIPRYEDDLYIEGVVRRCFESGKDCNIYAGIEFVNVGQALNAKLRSMCGYFNSQAYKDRRQERMGEKQEFSRS